MSDNGTVKGMQKLTTANNPVNQVSFMIDQAILAKVNTAEVVIVTEVEAGGSGSMAGYVDVKPLVCPTDGFNNALPPAVIYRLPYSRIQGGIAALVIDPAPGDIGLAVFAKRDCSGVRQGANNPVQPASFRQFDQADGFYIGGFLNKVPEIWLELNQNKEAVLHAPSKVIIKTKECVIDSPETCCTGNLRVDGNVAWGGYGRGANGPARFRDGIANTGGVIESNSITLDRHTHPGVETGNSSTQSPNTGT